MSSLTLTGAGPEAGVLVDPSTIAGLALWLKADAGTSTTTDGVAVSLWADQSGNARDAAQATGGNQPLYKAAIFNGKPVIRFDGTDDFMATAAYALNGGSTPTGITIFGAASLTAVGSFPMLAAWHNATNELRCNAGTGKPEFLAVGSSPGVGTATAINGTGAHVLTGRFSDANNLTECFVDGASVASGAQAGALVTAANASTVGARTAAADPWNGDVGEVLIYNGALSDTDRVSVEAYLKARWGTP